LDFTLLNNSLGGIEFSLSEDGKGQYRAVGADTVFPFFEIKNGNFVMSSSSIQYTGDPSFRITLKAGHKYYLQGAIILYNSGGGLRIVSATEIKVVDATENDQTIAMSYGGELGTYLAVYSYVMI